MYIIYSLFIIYSSLTPHYLAGFEEVVRLASVGGDSRKVMESAVNHISLLNNIITLQLQGEITKIHYIVTYIIIIIVIYNKLMILWSQSIVHT